MFRVKENLNDFLTRRPWIFFSMELNSRNPFNSIFIKIFLKGLFSDLKKKKVTINHILSLQVVPESQKYRWFLLWKCTQRKHVHNLNKIRARSLVWIISVMIIIKVGGGGHPNLEVRGTFPPWIIRIFSNPPRPWKIIKAAPDHVFLRIWSLCTVK